MATRRTVRNFIAFQIGWLACVVSAAQHRPLLGLLVASAVVALHVSTSSTPGRDLKLIGVAVSFGATIDSLLLIPDWLRYETGQPFAWLAPYWIVALWAVFATTLNESLAWLQRSRLLAAVCGASSAPLAYWAGAQIGAIELVEPLPALLAIGIAWGLVLPLLTHMARAIGSPATTTKKICGSELESHA
jgi:hypothetical protein